MQAIKSQLIFISTILILFFFSCEEEVSGVKPVYSKLTESVYASATVQPADAYQVFPGTSGLLEQLNIDEGDEVNRGQLLARIENTRLPFEDRSALLALEQAQKNLAGQSSQLTEIQTQIAAANTTVLNDSIQFARRKKLWDQGIGSRNEYDRAALSLQLSQKNRDALRDRYRQLQTQLGSQVALAQNNYRSSRSRSGDLRIESEMDGRVYRLYKQQGELISQQQPLALIGSRDSFLLDMQVDEVDIARIRTGQQVLITLDAYDQQVFRARVQKIYPQMDERRQTFRVEAAFVEVPEVLYPGLSGEANILINQKDKTLVIPKAYLMGNNRVQTEDGEVSIQTGLSNLDQVEVLSGIDTSTLIILPEE